MKKQQQERSARYRFWRNVGIITVSGLIGGVIGFLTGMFGSEKPLEIQSFFSKEGLLWGSILLFLIVFMVTIALLISARKVHQKMLQIEDEEEAYHYDIQKEKLFGLATIFKGVMILPYFLVIIFYSQWVYMDRPSTGHLPFALIGIFLIGTFFHTDILLALVVVSLIYLYILVSQYKITKRYYKE